MNARRSGVYFPAWARSAGLLWLALLLALAGCGRDPGRFTLEGVLAHGDTDVWLIDTTPVGIGGATIAGDPLPPPIGSRIRAEGRRAPDGGLEAEKIAVSPGDPAAAASSLPPDEAAGAVEAIDDGARRWRVAGREVWLPDGVAAPRGVKVGDQVTVRGFRLPQDRLLASAVTLAGAPPAPTAAPAAPPPAPTAAPKPDKPEPEKPGKPDKPGRRKPGNGDDGKKEDDDD